jgi:hypothetical protein
MQNLTIGDSVHTDRYLNFYTLVNSNDNYTTIRVRRVDVRQAARRKNNCRIFITPSLNVPLLLRIVITTLDFHDNVSPSVSIYCRSQA